MIGAIFGDIAGSRFEGETKRPRTRDFYLFTKKSHPTDDTVLSIAVAKSILENEQKPDYEKWIRYYAKLYPAAGYGSRFKAWMKDKTAPNDSYANGAPMRISPIAWAYEDIGRIFEEVCRSAEVTHNHKEAIRGSRALAGSIYYARIGKGKKFIYDFVLGMGYDLLPCQDHKYEFNLESKVTVPQAVSCFLQATSLIQTIRYAIDIGGDSDTLAAMAGAVAHAYYGISDEIAEKVIGKLPPKLSNVLVQFSRKYVDQGFAGFDDEV